MNLDFIFVILNVFFLLLMMIWSFFDDDDDDVGFIVDIGMDFLDECVDRWRYYDCGFDENDEDVDDLERRI